MAGGIRQDRRSAIRGTKSTILVRLRLRGLLRIMDGQVAVFASTSDGGVRSIETERGIVGANETIAGSPQDSWADAGRANESIGLKRVREIRLRLVTVVRPGRKRHLELTVDDSDLERFRRDTNQRTSMAKILVGVTGLGCFELGQDGVSTRTSARNHQINGGTTWR